MALHSCLPGMWPCRAQDGHGFVCALSSFVLEDDDTTFLLTTRLICDLLTEAMSPAPVSLQPKWSLWLRQSL